MKARGQEVRECFHCKASFTCHPSDIKGGCGKYCSKACAFEGRSNYAAILSALPGTIHDILKNGLIGEGAVMRSISRLVMDGRMHAAKLVPSPEAPRARQSACVLLFKPGPSPIPDAPVGVRDALYWFYDQAILKAMPGGQDDIGRKSGIPQATISMHLKTLHKAGKCHIKAWRHPNKDRGRFVAVWAAGEGVDAVCELRRLSDADYRKKHKEKIISEGRLEEYKLQRRETHQLRKFRRAGDPLVNALFGAPRERAARKEP